MRCAIYTRVSTEEQTRPEYNSCQSQQDICRHYVEIQREKGWEVFRVYEDAGYSGRNLKRPGIQTLLRDIKRGLVDIILCTRIDRISRSIKDFYEFWTLLEKHNVIFVSATESFDTSTAAGSLMVNLLLSFGAWEVAVVSERTSMKMLARTRKGLWNGGHVPLGYDYLKDQQLLVPNLDEKRIVVSLFETFLRERSIAGVRQFANAQGYRSKTRTVTDRSGNTRTVGGNPFSYDLIRQVLTNPIYKGCLRYGEEVFEGKHEPLIPPDLWELANSYLQQHVRDSRSLKRTADSHIHLFKGLLRCGECGSAATPYPSGKRKPGGGAYLYYTCLKAIKDRKHCTCKVRSLPARAFEDAILEALKELSEHPSAVQQYLLDGLSSERNAVTRLQNRFTQIQSELSVIDEKLQRLLGIFEESETVPDGLKTRCRELDEQRTRLKIEGIQVQQELDDLGGETPPPDEVAAFLGDFTRGLQGLSMAEKKTRIRSVISRMSYNPLPLSEGVATGQDGVLEGQFRTKCLLVIIQIHKKPAESLDSTGFTSNSYNQFANGSELVGIGSAGARYRRMKFALKIPIQVRCGRVRSQESRTRKITAYVESPVERAERFRQLLESGKFQSQEALAKYLGCSQAWISRSLGKLNHSGQGKFEQSQ